MSTPRMYGTILDDGFIETTEEPKVGDWLNLTSTAVSTTHGKRIRDILETSSTENGTFRSRILFW